MKKYHKFDITQERLKDWGLELSLQGELITGGCNSVELANFYGTPLHVVNETRLIKTAQNFLSAIKSRYPGRVSVHFAFKCNPVPGIIRLIKHAGLYAEVMSEFELLLALKLGYRGEEIIVNGPYKTDRIISLCLDQKVRLINVDSITELERINFICNNQKDNVRVLFRINPDFVPSGMNRGSASASRKGSPFGLDMAGGEVARAIVMLKKMPRISFRGFHLHIGSGIQNPGDYSKALLKLRKLIDDTEKAGYKIEILDVGGGLGVPCSREMTTIELLKYQGLDILPRLISPNKKTSFSHFADSVVNTVVELFGNRSLPELIFEPGRCITSPNQLLLLRVHQVKGRHRLIKWLVTDAGIGTLTMPAYYEYHEVLLCNDVRRKVSGKVTITGPGCFSADVVYRNKPMPEVAAGEILAILDSGAYFTSWESTFGFPRPAIISVVDGNHNLLRKREPVAHMMALDII
jgi:diaminopimelate decarboxylase